MSDKIYSPLKGKAIKMTEVNDPMFSEKMLGDGVAVYPEYRTGLFAKSEDIFAPCDGEVVLVFVEKHAIGFVTPSGNEILVHMGIETVEMKGAPFTITCKVGDKVSHGQKIGEVNWKMIAKTGRDTVVPVIWTNNDDAKEMSVVTDQGQVDSNTVLFEI